jgi:hypothetical protein
VIHRNIAVIAAAIINRHLLTQPLAEALEGWSPDRIHATTWREADHDTNGTAWII